MYGRNFTHFWRAAGDDLEVPPQCIVYNHYKILPWFDPLNKNNHTWIASVANSREEHTRMNQILCRKYDDTAATIAKQWNLQSELLSGPHGRFELLAEAVKNRTWPADDADYVSCRLAAGSPRTASIPYFHTLAQRGVDSNARFHFVDEVWNGTVLVDISLLHRINSISNSSDGDHETMDLGQNDRDGLRNDSESYESVEDHMESLSDVALDQDHEVNNARANLTQDARVDSEETKAYDPEEENPDGGSNAKSSPDQGDKAKAKEGDSQNDAESQSHKETSEQATDDDSENSLEDEVDQEEFEEELSQNQEIQHEGTVMEDPHRSGAAFDEESNIRGASSDSTSSMPRIQDHKSPFDFPASDSPLMMTAGIPTYTRHQPRACMDLFVSATGYSYRMSPTDLRIVVSLTAVGDLEDTPLDCVMYDIIHQRPITGELSFTMFRVTCVFSQLSQLADLPKVIFLVKPEFLPTFMSKSLFSASYIDAAALKLSCFQYIQPIHRPERPNMFLLAVTEIRDAAKHIESWITYNLHQGYDHIVIYDDCSKDRILDVLYPYHREGLVTYVNWTTIATWPILSTDRQMLAMEDFAIRFAPQSTLINQLDDDCFFYVPAPVNRLKSSVLKTSESESASLSREQSQITYSVASQPLRETLQYLLRSNTNAGQMLILGKWFGACNASSSSDQPFILKHANASFPLYSRMTWRHRLTWRVRSCNISLLISFA
jgi:hypothetical protein